MYPIPLRASTSVPAQRHLGGLGTQNRMVDLPFLFGAHCRPPRFLPLGVVPGPNADFEGFPGEINTPLGA